MTVLYVVLGVAVLALTVSLIAAVVGWRLEARHYKRGEYPIYDSKRRVVGWRK